MPTNKQSLKFLNISLAIRVYLKSIKTVSVNSVYNILDDFKENVMIIKNLQIRVKLVEFTFENQFDLKKFNLKTNHSNRILLLQIM